MKQNLYCIYDKKSSTYGVPFASPTHGTAERQIQTYVNDKQSPISMYPEDYDLYHVGSFEISTGLVHPEAKPSHLVNAAQLSTV